MNKKIFIEYSLSKKNIIFLFIYYGLLLLIGLVLSVFSIYEVNNAKNIQCNYLMLTFIASISVGVMFCAIQYIKRLYKACIDDRIKDKGKINNIGNMCYFIFRPIFVIAFVSVMIVLILSGMFIITGNLDYIINEKFTYLCTVASCFLGYSIGNFIDKFEKISKKKIDNFDL